MADLGLIHACSFRRQVYVHPGDINKIPETLKITFNNMVYLIFLSTERLTCFVCKNEGHLAKYCPTINNKPTELQTVPSNGTPIQQIQIPNNMETDISEEQVNKNINETQDQNNEISILTENYETNRTKRPLSHSSNSYAASQSTDLSDSESSIYSLSNIDDVPATDDEKTETVDKMFKIPKRTKKSRTEKWKDFTTTLLPLKKSFEDNANRFPTNYENFINFIDKMYGTPITDNTIKQHASIYKAVASMMREIYPLLNKDRSTKILFTKIIKKLEKTRRRTKRRKKK